MLGKTSVSMMVLLVAASLIGISSIHQYIEGQGPKPPENVQLEGLVVGTVISATKTCTALVDLPANVPNLLRVPPGTTITLIAPIESCVLFGLAQIGKTQIEFVTPAPTAPSNTKREFRVSHVIL